MTGNQDDDAPRRGSFRMGGDTYAYLSYAPERVDIPTELTEAEAAVVRLVAVGLSNRAIADQRAVSVRTVENQMASIFRRLRVASRAELLVRLFGPRPRERE